MKLKFLTLGALGALVLAGSAFGQSPAPETNQQHPHAGRGGYRHSPLERRLEQLNLTADERAKIQPILDKANPQLETIRREALEKAKAVVDTALVEIRPMLTPEQQSQLDQQQPSRHGGHAGRRNQQGQGSQEEDGSGN